MAHIRETNITCVNYRCSSCLHSNESHCRQRSPKQEVVLRRHLARCRDSWYSDGVGALYAAQKVAELECHRSNRFDIMNILRTRCRVIDPTLENELTCHEGSHRQHGPRSERTEDPLAARRDHQYKSRLLPRDTSSSSRAGHEIKYCNHRTALNMQRTYRTLKTDEVSQATRTGVQNNNDPMSEMKNLDRQ